jgi:hypothetical protein
MGGNPVLRPASLFDVLPFLRRGTLDHYTSKFIALDRLYRAEWKRRGYTRSP